MSQRTTRDLGRPVNQDHRILPRGFEPLPDRAALHPTPRRGVVVDGLRSLEPDEADRCGQLVRDELLGLLAAVPRGILTLRAGAHPSCGLPSVDCLLTGDVPDADADVAAVLAPLYRTCSAERPSPVPRRRFMLRSIRSSVGFVGGMGGAIDGGVHRLEAVRGRLVDLADRWLALAAQHPGVDLEVAVEYAGGGGNSYRVRCAVLSDEELPLRVRALIKDSFPGFVLDETIGADAVLEGDRDSVRDLLPLPGTPRAGLASVEPPPVHLRPRSTGSGTGEFRLGQALLPNGRRVDVGLSRAELVRHVHVVGHTGTGKSSAMAGLMRSFASAGLGFVVIDPHGELVDRCVAELPRDAAARAWLIRAGDLANPAPINPLALDDEEQFETVLQDLVLIFYQLFDPRREGIVGPRFETLFTQAVRGLRALNGPQVSLLDVPRAYRDRSLERRIAAAVTAPHLVDYWRREIPAQTEHTRSEMLGWFTSKFDRFTTTAAMRGILGSGADGFDPAQAMDENRIILLDLSKASLGSVAADLLGFLHLTRLWTGFQRRRTTTPFGVFVDEAHSFNAGSLPAMLSEGRKRGAAVVVAHQFLSQLETRLADALSGNTATTIAFRTSPKDARLLQERLGDTLPLSRLTTAPDLTAVLGRTSSAEAAEPHTLYIDHNTRVTPRQGVDLERFERLLLDRTRRDLVEPHLQLEGSPKPDHASDGARENRFPPAVAHVLDRSSLPPAKLTEPGFLEDWLRRRQQAKQVTDLE